MSAFFDAHVFTDHSEGGKSSLGRYCAQAWLLQMNGFCALNACPVQRLEISAALGAVRQLVSAVDAAREVYSGRLFLSSGIEIGDAIWKPDRAHELATGAPVDEVVGAVYMVRYHRVHAPYRQLNFTTMTERTLQGYLTQYFEDVLETVELADLDVLAYLTGPLYFLKAHFRREVSWYPYAETIDRILQCMISRGITLEVYTGGLFSPLGELVPDAELLSRYHSFGGELITLGSGAVQAEELAGGFRLGEATLRRIGFSASTRFRHRVPEPVPLRQPNLA